MDTNTKWLLRGITLARPTLWARMILKVHTLATSAKVRPRSWICVQAPTPRTIVQLVNSKPKKERKSNSRSTLRSPASSNDWHVSKFIRVKRDKIRFCHRRLIASMNHCHSLHEKGRDRPWTLETLQFKPKRPPRSKGFLNEKICFPPIQTSNHKLIRIIKIRSSKAFQESRWRQSLVAGAPTPYHVRVSPSLPWWPSPWSAP